MASLYTTSQNGRKVFIVILFLIIGILAYDTYNSFQVSRLPRGINERRFYMSPDNKFGDIAVPKIKAIPLAEGSSPSYSLRTPTFPVFPDVAYVYKIEKPSEKLGVYESILSKAQTLSFPQNLLKEEDRNLVWTILDNSKTLKFERDLLRWQLTTSYTNNIEAIRNKTIAAQTSNYGKNALTLLRKIVLNSNSFNYGFRDAQQSIKLANIGPSGQFYEVKRSDEAEYVRVDLFRQLPFADVKPDAELPELTKGERKPIAVTGTAYTDDPRIGMFSAIVSNNFTDYSKDLFEFNFTDFNYTAETGKYLIINPADAWTKIQTNSGSLVSIQTQETDQFSIFPTLNVKKFEADPLKTTLGFFEPREWTGYTTPIYIFTGTATLDSGRLANFTFYVNALKERIVQVK